MYTRIFALALMGQRCWHSIHIEVTSIQEVFQIF